jgi:hypothetical protein
MEWKRSDTLALASPQCMQCHGSGLLLGRRGAATPCNCVLRSVFRACYTRFRYHVSKDKHISRAALEYRSGRRGKGGYGMKDEEYVADFCLISRRVLSDEDYRIFKYHFLLGADWRLCCRKLDLNRGLFFHAIYRIEQKLGRAFRETQPYALFPLDEYFNDTVAAPVEPSTAREKNKVVRFKPVRPSIKLSPTVADAELDPISRTA